MPKKPTRHRDTPPALTRPKADVAAPNGAAAAPFPVVGIGASAGGLGAIETFFTHMSADAGADMAFVLVQHLAPDHRSLLTELVQRFTRMTVAEITDGTRVEPNHVYIIPPNKDLELFHGTLHLKDPVKADGLHLSIDAFFRSLAQDQRERAIGIVLSGAGSDGALGVRALKELDGMVMVQAPDSAEYASMPRSAIATGLADLVLPPDEMPAALLSYIHRLFARPRHPEEAPAEQNRALLQKIFLLLRGQTRHDFSGYKINTIYRRIERRMTIHRIETLAEYLLLLQQTPREVQILFHELLIGVTRFFRDPEAFEALSREVVPALFADRHAGAVVRVWVPGCSTGEEAFSLAMIMSEYAGERQDNVTVSIFATDIDTVAIEQARRGNYPANIAADVSPERLERFFVHDGNSYTVKRSIRDLVVFAEQDVILDPPFSHLDLISCRNLLIYLNAEVQKQLLPVFHYALNSQRFLWLGASESVGEFTDLFTPLNRKWKVYQRKDVPAIPFRPLFGWPPRGAVLEPPTPPAEARTTTEHADRLRTLLEEYLLAAHTPAGVLVNESGEILFVHGSTGRYLEAAPGAPNLNITRMARKGLRLELISAFHQAVTRKEAVRLAGIRLVGDHPPVLLNLLVAPLPAKPELFVVVFTEETVEAEPGPAPAPTTVQHDQRIVALELELQAKDAFLQHNMEELTTANEELQSANEELQSTNEELDTSKEELQSVNEELSTVNTELQRKIDALTLANDDMTNLLASSEVGTVFVDAEQCIQRFTPAATDIINLIPSDIGRPLTHLTVNLRDYDRLAADTRQVFATLVPHEVEVQAISGRWYLMRILPYRTQNNAIAGVVITFVEITRQKTLQEEMAHLRAQEQAHAFAERVVQTVREPLLVLDAELRVASANRTFFDNFQVAAGETIGICIYELGNGQWNIPELRKLLEEILPERATMTDYVVRHTFEHIGPRTMRLNASELRRIDGEQRMILLAIEDITGQRP